MQEAGGILKADRKREQMKISCDYRRSGEQEPEVPEEGLGWWRGGFPQLLG